MLRNVKLTLEYDGSRFFGFQKQNDKPSIQAALEKALSRLFNRPMKITAAAGRTDAGAHAQGQVVNFKTDSKLPLEKIQKGLNALLPHTVAVKEIENVALHFHARYGARWKTYEYVVLNSPVRSPLLSHRAYPFPYPLDLKKMRKAARLLVGRHDFKAFQATGSSAKTSKRTVSRLEIKIDESHGLIRFLIQADGFLYHMVRSMVGTLLEVGRGRLPFKDFERLFKKKQRLKAGPTVPAHGLTLLSVEYKG